MESNYTPEELFELIDNNDEYKELLDSGDFKRFYAKILDKYGQHQKDKNPY